VEEWEQPWGDKLKNNSKANKSSLRIIFWNCGGFPNDRVNPKNQLICNALLDAQADIAALAEVNTSWKMLRPHDRLHERTWGWFSALQISHSYASDFPAPTAHLKGGTAIFTINKVVHQVASKSTDQMGRWTSTLIRGTQNRFIRIISAYRCVKNIHGPLSVWNQQRYLLDLQRCELDPIDKFDQDLKIFLEECLNAGELIVMGIDVNEDVRTGTFSQFMRSLGLVDICTNKHGTGAPPTYARGATPIDALYVSSAFVGLDCGYLPVACDHRILWMDVPYTVAFGRKFTNFPTHTPQRLILQDPRVVKRYVDVLQNFLQEHKVLDKATELRKAMDLEGSNAELVLRYDEIDDIRLQGILLANKKCRHIKMGQVPYSPVLVIAWNRIRAYQLLRKKLSGGRVCSRYLRRALKLANIKFSNTMTSSEANECLSKEWAKYKILKKQAESLRATWLEEVASARIAEGQFSLAQELNSLNGFATESNCQPVLLNTTS
jgi:hypothetical protein